MVYNKNNGLKLRFCEGKDVQLSIYDTREDEPLMKKVEVEAKAQRKTKSAVILCVLEKYFERERKIGEILHDISSLSDEQLTKVLDTQKKEKKRRLLGEILLEEGFIDEGDLQRALSIQNSNEH